MPSIKIDITSLDEISDRLDKEIAAAEKTRIPQTVAEIMPHIVGKMQAMKQAGFSNEEISAILAKSGIPISASSVNVYIRRYVAGAKAAPRKRNVVKPVSLSPEKVEKQQEKAEKATEEKKPAAPSKPIINNPAPLDDA